MLPTAVVVSARVTSIDDLTCEEILEMGLEEGCDSDETYSRRTLCTVRIYYPYLRTALLLLRVVINRNV